MLMLNTYILIKDAVAGDSIGSFLDPADKEFYISTLADLIREETIHASLVSSNRGKMVRIR